MNWYSISELPWVLILGGCGGSASEFVGNGTPCVSHLRHLESFPVFLKRKWPVRDSIPTPPSLYFNVCLISAVQSKRIIIIHLGIESSTVLSDSPCEIIGRDLRRSGTLERFLFYFILIFFSPVSRQFGWSSLKKNPEWHMIDIFESRNGFSFPPPWRKRTLRLKRAGKTTRKLFVRGSCVAHRILLKIEQFRSLIKLKRRQF